MKKMMTLIAAALGVFAAWAADITLEQAKLVAGNFVAKDAIALRTLPGRTVDTVTRRGGLYLVTLKPSGYLFVSVNRSARPIPTFSEYDFVEPEAGSPLAVLLASAETNSVNAVGSAYESQWKTLLGEKVLRLKTSAATEYVNIDPMVTTLWGQTYPYYELTPVVSGTHTLVGCVATAYAQIMRYWQWPAVLNEDFVSEHVADTVSGYTLCLGAGTVFDWQDMPKSYANDYPTRLKLARGSLLAGMLSKMKYNLSASGAQTSQPGLNDWYTPYICLDTTTSLVERVAGMRKSLQEGCPFMVSVDYGDTGHAVVGDGWQESESGSFVRLNYGWQESTIIYYDPSTLKGVYLYQKPNPMVQNKPLPLRSALPVKVEWAFPSKGYEQTLNGFNIVYREVSSTATDWTDDLTDPKGTIQGDSIQVEEIADCGEGKVLRLGTSADNETYTWPAMVATENTVFSYAIHSYNAYGMVVYVQLLDPTLGWLTIATPELGTNTEIPWKTHSIDLGQYAGRGIAIRVKVVRNSDTRYQDDKFRSTGVQFDNVKLTSVYQAVAGEGVKVTAGKDDRSLSISGSLAIGKTYLFQVTPTFSDAKITGIPGYPASCKIVSEAVEKPSIKSVESVTTSAPAVQSGMYRACYLGRNQFGVYCSSATTTLEARLSHRAVASEVQEPGVASPGSYVTGYKCVWTTNDVTIAKKAGENGKFLVTVDFSDLTTYAKNTGMILTLIARNAEGDVDLKDVFLCLSNTGGEAAIDVANLPESGTPISDEEEEEEEEEEDPDEPTGGDDPDEPSGVDEPTGGDDPDEPTGGDDPIIDPTDGNANDFTEGSVNYRFCNGVDKTSGFSDVHRSGSYNTLPPISYNLIYWWTARYQAAFGTDPSDYVAPSESNMATSDNGLDIAGYTATLLDSALSKTLPAGTEREKYFPAANTTAATWYGTASDKAVQVGRHIYAALAKGPIGFKAHTSSSKFYCGVIWGCEYSSDDTGKYATKLWVTDTRTKGDGVRALSFGNYSNSYGSLPGLKDFNGSGTYGVIEYYYPIVGPAVSSGGEDDPEDPDPEDPDPEDPDPGRKVPKGTIFFIQ